MNLVQLMRSFREEAGLSQQQLGDCLGLAPTRISEIERGLRHLRFVEAAAWWRACGLGEDQWRMLRDATLS